MLLGVATWGRGCGGCGKEAFVEFFFWHGSGKLVLKWWDRYTMCTYIDSLSPFSRMGTWCQIMYDGAIKWRQIRSKSCKILSNLCRDRDETTLSKPNAFAFAETVTFSQDPHGFQLPPPHINFLHLYPNLSGSGCLWPWYPRQTLTAKLITPVNETSYSINSTFGNLVPLPLSTFCPN